MKNLSPIAWTWADLEAIASRLLVPVRILVNGFLLESMVMVFPLSLIPRIEASLSKAILIALAVELIVERSFSLSVLTPIPTACGRLVYHW